MNRELLIARFDTPRRHLYGAMAMFCDADLDWTPTEGMRTVGGQLFEIAAKEVEVWAWIRNGEWDDALAYEGTFPTMAAWTDELDSIRAQTLADLAVLSEEDLDMPVQNPNRWQEGLGLPTCSMGEVIGFIAAHEWYHAGQLIAYLLMRGDDTL